MYKCMLKSTNKDNRHGTVSPEFNYAETSLSTKFPHQEIRWNYGIFHSESSVSDYTLLPMMLDLNPSMHHVPKW